MSAHYSQPLARLGKCDSNVSKRKNMNEEYISVIDAASQLGMPHKQTLFKVIKRLNIETRKQRNSASRNQLIAYISPNDYERIKKYQSESQIQTSKEKRNDTIDEKGVFYLIQLEPKCDSGRYKVGFATNLSERMRAHRCSAPFAQVVETWPCKPLWEKTAIDCVTQSCAQIHTEVFKTDDLELVKSKCENFFSQMPEI
jgi:hypothetical protein